jgi:Tol biopolymer transport system component
MCRSIMLAIAAAALAGVPAAGDAPDSRPAAERTPQILFSSDRSGSWRIWIADEDGGSPRQLVPDPAGEAADEQHDVDPVFSPDAGRILFTSTRGGKVGLWIARADGKELRRVCDGDQGEWAPDGKRICLRRDGRILTRSLEDGAEKTLTPEGWKLCSGPSWSPDGKQIAFACRWDAGNGIYLVSPDGGQPTKVYDKNGACEPHWSPDGKTLAYETETHVCTILPDGTKNRLVTWFGGVQRYPRWSPDGTELIFCQGASEKGPWEIYKIPAAGGQPQKLTDGGSDMYPHWK